MAVVPSNMIMGPAALYWGAFGAVEPADTAVATAPASNVWTDLGGTMGGVEIAINQDFTELEVDQIVDVPGRRLTKRDATVTTKLAEPTLDNLAKVLNHTTTITDGTGFKSYEPSFATSATQPTYFALLIDGIGPNSHRRRIIVRKALSTDNVEFAYKKDDQAVYTVTFSAHYVSSVIAPFKVIDEDPEA